MGFFDDRVRSKDREINPTLPPCPRCKYEHLEFNELTCEVHCPRCGFTSYLFML